MLAYVTALYPLGVRGWEMRLSLYLPDSNDQQTGDTFVWVSKIEILVPPVRVMLCLLLLAAVREITPRSERNQAVATLDCYTAVFSVVTQRSSPQWNGCVTDYFHAGSGMCKFTCFSACLNARLLCLSFNMANLCRLQVTWAPHVHKGRSTVAAILKELKNILNKDNI